MIYNKALIKSITDLLNVLSEIDDTGGNGDEIVLDDGSVMTLSLVSDKATNPRSVEKISVTSATLNLEITVRKEKQNDDHVLRLVKKKPEKTIIKLKKRDGDER